MHLERDLANHGTAPCASEHVQHAHAAAGRMHITAEVLDSPLVRPRALRVHCITPVVRSPVWGN
jgi:hypothetical protein